MKAFIAKDTKQPLVVLSGYHIVEGGGIANRPIVRTEGKDYGADPIGDGTYRMVPSGDIVDYAERCKRLE